MSSTTESVESVHSIESVEAVTLEIAIASLKTYAVADLFKVSKAALAEAEKRVKTGKLDPKVVKEKKATPKQLQKPTQWVRFVLAHAAANGWEAFTVENKKSHELIEMPASVLNEEGAYVYPDGKAMILTHAMSLSKQYWAPKAKEGTRKDLYDEFEAAYVAEAVTEEEDVAPKQKFVRKTAEEKAQELADKKAERERLAAQKKEENKKKRDETKAANAEAKKKAEEEKKAEKVVTKPAKVVAAPKAAVKTPVKAVETPIAAPAAPVKPKKPAAPKAAVWSCPADGNVYPWDFSGQKYLRNSENQVWHAEADGSCGDWAGLYMPEGNIIDDSAADPFADEE